MTDSDLNVEVRGPSESPPVLLLHGWGRSLHDLRPLAQALTDAYWTHAVDLPGHGASPPPPEPWGVPEHAQLVHDYIRREIQSRVTVVGHSNGGRIALYMAGTAKHASAVNRLALVSPSGVEPERSWAYRTRSGLATALKAPVQALPAPLQAPAEDWLRHSLVWQWLGSDDYNAQDGVMRETFVKTVNDHLDEELERVRVPTLLFWGTEDDAVSRRQMDVMKTKIDDCGLVELEGAGHFGHLDQPDTVRAGLRHFLENS
ncbi:MAG: alpha/beta hydrolase [Salinibacter sp.]|uniref:alpha/beta fold hydrolase n=1 Tax=Salinibacter sp. TaxID=2065818 RepID=UPI002FC2A0A7